MIASRDSDSGSNRIPLKWADGYFISHDGVVSRADGSTLKSVPLVQARRYARQSMQHDPLREAASGVTHGRGGMDELVFVEDGGQRVQFVQMWSNAAREAMERGETVSGITGFTMPAVGDTAGGWYWMRGNDGARCVFHAPSYAGHLFAARQ